MKVALVFSIITALKVVTTYPYIKDITEKIGGERVKVFSLAKGSQDPHFVVPRPSFIAKVSQADVFIINGASLEIGFAPAILERAGNPRVAPGGSGFLDLSQAVELIEKPKNISRALGDVHPEGNPHFWLDPYNIPVIAEQIREKLCSVDPEGCALYTHNEQQFRKLWSRHLKKWEEALAPLAGKRVIQYHRLFDYFIRAFHLEDVGTLEPKPGIPPTAKHITELIKRAKHVDFIFQDVYHSDRTARFVAEKLGAKLLILPHDVGAVPEVKDIFDLFNYIVNKLTSNKR